MMTVFYDAVAAQALFTAEKSYIYTIATFSSFRVGYVPPGQFDTQYFSLTGCPATIFDTDYVR
jgi:hypothetical protein